MDPLSSLLAALIAGAATALQTTVADVVKDSYAALKHRLAERYMSVDLAAVERDPEAQESRRALEQQLRQSGASSDSGLVSAATALLEHLAQDDPDHLAGVIGVDLEEIKAGRVRIADIISAGVGVRVKQATTTGDFEITGVRAGGLKEISGKL